MVAEARTVLHAPRDRLFTWAPVILAAFVLVGFAPTYYLNAFMAHRSLNAVRLLHGAAFTLWMVLLFVQARLVATGRRTVHRRLGVAGAVLAGTMVGLGLAVAIDGARHGFQTPGLPPPQIFLVIPFFDMVVFALLVGAAVALRRRPDLHKRLMVLATLTLLPAALGRMTFIPIADPVLHSFLTADVVLLALVAGDAYNCRRLSPAWTWGGLLFILSQPLRMAVAGTAAWLAMARLLIGS